MCTRQDPYLGINKRRKIVKHAHGKGNIVRILKMLLTNAIAVMDEDPDAPEPVYLKNESTRI